jgi:hypothetical protein
MGEEKNCMLISQRKAVPGIQILLIEKRWLW